MNKEIEIKDKDMGSKCGWSPFNKMKLRGCPIATIVNGEIKMLNGNILNTPNGKVIDFD